MPNQVNNPRWRIKSYYQTLMQKGKKDKSLPKDVVRVLLILIMRSKYLNSQLRGANTFTRKKNPLMHLGLVTIPMTTWLSITLQDKPGLL